MNTNSAFDIVLYVLSLLAFTAVLLAPSIVGHARDLRIDRQLRRAEGRNERRGGGVQHDLAA
ncbi:hypothetical protein G5C51_35960 [Streptomyces sp. A7024]|uniref:Uncharacterized protein n=1 Tax=Streptomyces coryli TaxID=1128680 RepID=A0A6G4UC27_9ACTN|nr:hypothetical protein [Streptomyces coryli]NGN69270.1 hypothetical protein [Streptomyces coryli]